MPKAMTWLNLSTVFFFTMFDMSALFLRMGHNDPLDFWIPGVNLTSHRCTFNKAGVTCTGFELTSMFMVVEQIRIQDT